VQNANSFLQDKHFSPDSTSTCTQTICPPFDPQEEESSQYYGTNLAFSSQPDLPGTENIQSNRTKSLFSVSSPLNPQNPQQKPKTPTTSCSPHLPTAGYPILFRIGYHHKPPQRPPQARHKLHPSQLAAHKDPNAAQKKTSAQHSVNRRPKTPTHKNIRIPQQRWPPSTTAATNSFPVLTFQAVANRQVVHFASDVQEEGRTLMGT
jgi:hypothetical protein